MKTLISLLLFLVSLKAFSQGQDYVYQQPSIPSSFSSTMQEYLFFDNNFNVVQRLRSEEKANANLMSHEDKAAVEVSLFKVDLNQIKGDVFLSRFVEKNDLEKVKTLNGEIFIPCLNSDKVSYNILRMRFGPPAHQTWGHKVLSRATYYIDPVGSIGGFFAKFIPHVPGLEQKLEREVLVNDYVKSQLFELPTDMRKLTMDSFMSVNLSVLGLPIAVAYRSADRILEAKSENIKTFPGHGLLGCDACVTEYAIKKTGLTNDPDKAVDRWKTKELLPKLAKYMAYANHVLGASFESHTQNMIFDVNTQTGEIKNIYFRDFADVLLNPVPVLAENRLPTEIDWQRVKLLSVHGNYFSDQGVQVAKDIWYHASVYSGQGITSHIQGFQRQQRHLRIFLESYIAATEGIIGQPIELSEDAKKIMAQLEQKVPKSDFYSGELQDRSPLRNAMASVLKPIYEQVYKIKTNKIQSELLSASISQDQKKLGEKFYELLTLQRVVFMGDNEKNRLAGADGKYTWLKNTLNAYFKLGLGKSAKDSEVIFKLYQNRLWAIDRVTQSPLAVTLEAFELKQSLLQRLNPFLKEKAPVPAVIRCEAIFR